MTEPTPDANSLEEALANIRARDGEIHAFLHVDAEGARKQSVAAPAGPLHRFPIAVKDNIVRRGASTTCGSKLLEEFVSPWDASVISKLEAAGGVIVGKTNLDEFAMGSSTEFSAFGPTRNPWDGDRVPGGSSGGSAAAVAARMARVALGSDTGGSVRQPAAFCGVIGLKPTWGRVSRAGLVAFASSLDQIGVLARDAADCAAVLGVIAGRDELDSTSSEVVVPDYGSFLGEGVAGRSFGIVREAVDLLEGGMRASFDRAVSTLEEGGAEIVEVSVPMLPQAVAIYAIIANAEASSNLGRFDGIRYGRREGSGSTDAVYTKSRGEGFGEEVKRRIMLGTFALSSGYYDAYYSRAQRARRRLSGQIAEALSRAEFLLTPTTPHPPFRLGEKVKDPRAMALADLFTVPGNLAGIPAIAIPTGVSDSGLPESIQVMARPFEEGALLSVARWMESSRVDR